MKILIVDDSSFVRNIIVKALKTSMEGVEVITANDGKEALTAYHEHMPDLVVTDLLMPNMTGQELLKALKVTYPYAKAIVISADIQTATRDELEEIGVIGFINKPMSADKFAQLVEMIRGNCHA